MQNNQMSIDDKMAQAVANRDKILQTRAERQLAETAEAIEGLYDFIIGEATNKQLPEPLFVEHFLPYFSGRKIIDRNTPIIAEWISVAGSPMAEVDVIDHTGTILFTVPGVYSTKGINPKRPMERVASSIESATYMHNLRKRNFPRQASQAFQVEMEEAANELYVGGGTDTDTRWNDIFERYGIFIGKKEETKVEEEDDDHIEFEYEY